MWRTKISFGPLWYSRACNEILQSISEQCRTRSSARRRVDRDPSSKARRVKIRFLVDRQWIFEMLRAPYHCWRPLVRKNLTSPFSSTSTVQDPASVVRIHTLLFYSHSRAIFRDGSSSSGIRILICERDRIPQIPSQKRSRPSAPSRPARSEPRWFSQRQAHDHSLLEALWLSMSAYPSLSQCVHPY